MLIAIAVLVSFHLHGAILLRSLRVQLRPILSSLPPLNAAGKAFARVCVCVPLSSCSTRRPSLYFRFRRSRTCLAIEFDSKFIFVYLWFVFLSTAIIQLPGFGVLLCF